MTNEEELQALREENRLLKALVAELLPLKEQLVQANARIKDLEDRLAKDSRTSSKPPSSDGLARLPRRSGRRSDAETETVVYTRKVPLYRSFFGELRLHTSYQAVIGLPAHEP
jgi:Family of unknown function (DUF6444)